MNNTVQNKPLSPRITVIGVGGAGCNAVNNMILSDLEGAEFMVCNTDAQALGESLADIQIQLGQTMTKGLGAGSNPDVGRAAAEESIEEVVSHLDGVNMAFITAGMGGGTGTGAAPVIARAVRERGILTVGVVTKPFQFEGAHRMRLAESGLKELQDVVDTLIVIPNQNLFRIANQNTTFAEAFKLADSVLQAGVRGVTDLMVKPGLINLDFADVRCAMMEMGKAMMGTGEATGERKAIEAAEAAINNPLLDDVSMKGARGVIINITGGYDMTLFDVDEACNRIRDEVDTDANIIFGSTFDDKMEGVMRVSIVATGIDAESVRRGQPFSSGNSIVGATRTESVAPSAVPQIDTAQPATVQDMPQGRVVSQGISLSGGVGASVPAPSVTPAAASMSAQPAPSPVYTPAVAQAAMPSQTPSFPPAPVAARGGVQGNAAMAMPVEEQPVMARGAVETEFRAPERAIAHEVADETYESPLKKPMSLFDRFRSGKEGGGATMQEASQQPQQQPQPQSPAATQPQLNIETPEQPSPQPKDNLDIPAFLRRQAS